MASDPQIPTTPRLPIEVLIPAQGGKGRKDRDVMLSPKLLEVVREHWRGLRHKPSAWLFPGNRSYTGDTPITSKVVWNARGLHRRSKRSLVLSQVWWANDGRRKTQGF